MSKPNTFSPEIRERAVRTVYEVREAHASRWASIEAVASKVGCTPPGPEQLDT
jgi:transposase